MTNEFKGARLFLNIPVEVAHDKRIKSDKSKLLFGEIYSMLNVTGSFYMSNKEIAKRINAKSIRTVQNCLDELEKLGYIKRVEVPSPSNSKITQRKITSDWRPRATDYTKGAKSVTQGARNKLRTPYVKDYTQIEQNNRTTNKTDIYSPAEPNHTAQTRKSIIDYLNEKLGTNYKPNATKNKKVINARLNEGYTIDDFKKVIDNKYLDWIGDPKMVKFLRPETLFGTKFDGYLNEQPAQQLERPKRHYV